MINNFLFRKLPVKILLELRKSKNSIKNNLRMSREIECTYKVYSKIVKKFEMIGFLKIEKIGRENIIHLTKKGKEIADQLMLMNKKLKK